MRFNEDEEKYLKLINNTRQEAIWTLKSYFVAIGPSFVDFGNDIILMVLNWQIGNREARIVMLEVVRLYNNQGPRMFSCFFKECLTNRIRDMQRQTQAHKRIPAGCLYALRDDFAETLTDFLHHSPDEVIYCRQSLHHLLCHCSKFEREVLVYLHTGYSITEIADTLNCSKRSVQSALHRCHNKLLNILIK